MKIIKTLSIASLFGFALSLQAAPGDLDTTFGGGKGWVSTGFQGIGANNRAANVIRQADGKLVAVGYVVGASQDFGLVRYNSDGSLDTTFDRDGKVITAVGSNLDSAYGVIQQLDGKLLVAGISSNGSNNDFALVRYNSDASLDATFDGDGKVVTNFSGGSIDTAYAILQQTDGKLVLAGSSYLSGGTDDFALVRYNSDGSLDTTFDGDGKVTTPIGTGGDAVYAVIQQADGKLVAIGYAAMSTTDFALVRYNSDGSLDTTFDGDGKVTTDISANTDSAYSIVQQADGKLIVAGSAPIAGANDFILVRYNSDGSLDTTFDGDGKVTTAIGAGSDTARSLIKQSDGKLVVAGSSSNGTNDDFAVVRYNSDGSLDTTFDGDGKVTTAIGTGTDVAYSIVQQADNKIVAAGYRTSFDDDFALVRYNADGSLDTSFDADGKTNTDIGTSNDTARSIIQQTDGKLVAAGHRKTGSFDDFAVARYSSNGNLDNTFGILGMVTGDTSTEQGQSIIQQSDGKLVIAGSMNPSDFGVLRYSTSGALDTGFGVNGKVTTPIGTGNDIPYDIIQQQDGKLVAAGYSFISSSDFALVRYNTDGSLDTTFDGDGKVTTDIAGSSDTAYSVIQQQDGKLVAAGSNLNDFVVARYNVNGSLDTSFDGDGIVTTSVGTTDYAYSVIQQPDGKLVVAGYARMGSTDDFALVRYNTDGSLDSTFDGDGKVTTTIGTSTDRAYSLVLQSDGKLVATGYGLMSTDDFQMVRYNANGSLDTGFGVNGKITKDFAGGADQAYAVLQQSDGKLAAAGISQGMPSGREFFVVRLESGQLDTDNDGYVDWLDTDNDNDGVLNPSDAFPLDTTEWLDTDADSVGNNADWDDDADGVPDSVDAAPLDNVNTSEIVLPVNGVYKGTALKKTMMAH